MLLKANLKLIPDRGRHTLTYMIRDNWLNSYAQKEGIQRAFQGLSRRTKFESKLEQGVQDLTNDYKIYEDEFKCFFKEIIPHISQFREDLINSDI